MGSDKLQSRDLWCLWDSHFWILGDFEIFENLGPTTETQGHARGEPTHLNPSKEAPYGP